ncbi:MAG: hypothetical protein FJW85_03720 [Actinobacteria bacterium]|nr:hypothetical protein [Actinomycetota bacterium]
MSARAMLAGIAAASVVVTALVAPPAIAVTDASSENAVIGPVRYSESAGAQDPVYGASFVVIGDAYAENVITGDDTVILTLTGATSGTGKVWISRTNQLFPSGGGLADDTLTLMDPSSPASTVGSGNPFSIVQGDTDDDTILQTFIAVSAPGTYSGDVYIYEGSSPTMSASTVVQHTKFRFTTARAPRSISIDPTSLDLIATTADVQSATVQVLDDSGQPTQLSVADRIEIATSNAAIADPAESLLDAQSFDDSLLDPLGSATLSVRGGASAGSATITLTPQGTLPSSGVRPVTLAATSIPLSTKSPDSFEMVFPDEQRIIDEARSTDDTNYYIVNDLFITNVLLVAEGADADSGIVGYVSTSNSDWRGLVVSGGGPSPTERVANNQADVPVVLASGSDGTVAAAIAWESVTEGGTLTIRTGTGASTRWTVIEVQEPTPEPRTSPSGRIIAKAGEPLDFIVTLRDDFGNPYSNFRVNGQARSFRGTPVGPVSSWERTDEDGRTTVTVDPPDDTHVGPATIVFSVTLPSGLPYTALTPPLVRVTYSESGQPSVLTVAQAQSAPATITPTTVQTAIPHVLVPFTGRAATSSGTPGTWTLPTASSPSGSGAAAGTMVTFTPTSVPAAQVEVRAPEGVWLSTSSRADWDDGKSEVVVDSGSPVYAYSTTVGTHALEFTVGTLVNDVQMRVSTTADAAYSVTSAVDDTTLVPGSFSTMSVKVVDAFGNPVPRTTDDSGGVTAVATGQLMLSGFQSQARMLTDDSGVSTITLIAGRAAGDARVRIAPPSTTRTPAWQANYQRPAGFDPPVKSIDIDFLVANPPTPVQPTVTIIGERTTLNGRSGIEITGETTDLPVGTTLFPWLRLTGQTAFARGASAITPDAEGDFTWSRVTSKVARVYVATADGAVRSNRVTIR